MDSLISTEEASKIIMASTRNYGHEEVKLEQSLGRITATEWKADRDFPPYDRVAMDGIAIHRDALTTGTTRFQIQGIAAAGNPRMTLHRKDHCLEVMTGSILPHGTNLVIPYELIEIEGSMANLSSDSWKEWQNIHRQGNDRKKGDILLKAGHKISAAEIATAATIGMERLTVKTHPSVAIVSTGDELVPIGDIPLAHQIRMSNSAMIASELRNRKIYSSITHIADSPQEISTSLAKIISEHDVLILSGGVSKGKFDYIPDSLQKLRIKKHFHGIAQKPGKPFWFGSSEDCVVFALPGNPVSSFFCLHRYVIPWLDGCLGIEAMCTYAKLMQDVPAKKTLDYFIQVKVHADLNAYTSITPIEGGGSGDLANLMSCDAFAKIPAGQDQFKNSLVEYIRYR